ASGFTEADIKWHSQHDALRDLFTKRQQATVVSPTAQVHVAQIQVATPRPVGGDFQSFTDQLKKVSDVGKALDAGTDFGEIAKQYSEESATKDNGGDMGWIAHGMITDLSAEKELFTLDAGKVSQQHNGLTTTTWYKVIEKSGARGIRPRTRWRSSSPIARPPSPARSATAPEARASSCSRLWTHSPILPRSPR